MTLKIMTLKKISRFQQRLEEMAEQRKRAQRKD